MFLSKSNQLPEHMFRFVILIFCFVIMYFLIFHRDRILSACVQNDVQPFRLLFPSEQFPSLDLLSSGSYSKVLKTMSTTNRNLVIKFIKLNKRKNVDGEKESLLKLLFEDLFVIFFTFHL